MTRMTHNSRTLAMAALCVLGITFTAVALDTIRQIGVAHAEPAGVPTPDPIVAESAAVDSTWSTIETYGPLWGGALIVFAAVGAFLKRNESKHWLAQGRTLAFITTGSMLLGAALTWQFHGHDTGGLLMSVFVAIKMLVSPTVDTPQAMASPTSFDSQTVMTKLPQSGRIRISTMVLVAVGALLAMPLLGCNTLSSAPSAAKDAVVDCTKADSAAIGALLSELGADAVTTALGTGKADWSKLEADALAQGKVIGGCALAEFVAAIGKAAPAQPASSARTFVATTSPATDARAALDQFRAQVGGGRWSTEVQ